VDREKGMWEILAETMFEFTPTIEKSSDETGLIEEVAAG
jgi:hypothetical protein